MGTTYLAGGALGGRLVDAYGSYGVPFLVAGALGQVASLTFLFVSTERQASFCSGAGVTSATIAAAAGVASAGAAATVTNGTSNGAASVPAETVKETIINGTTINCTASSLSKVDRISH